MLSEETISKSKEQISCFVAQQLNKSFKAGGITLYIIDPDSTEKIQDTRAQVRRCGDISQVISIIQSPYMEYLERPMQTLLDEATEVAATYDERELDAIEASPSLWDNIPGFESACHMREAIQAATRAIDSDAGELSTLRAPMGAEAPYAVAQTSEWSIVIEEPPNHYLPIRVIASLESLRQLLS